MKNRTLAIALLGLVSLAARAEANEWITAPSYFTHDPQTGQRVQQYTPIGPFYIQPRGDYRRSGYRNTRSSIQAGGSADHLHIVEEWGHPVRPYGEWRFPYRPNSVPYDLWGPPVPAVVSGGGFQRGLAPNQFPSGHNSNGYHPQGPSGRPSKGLNVRPYPGYNPQPSDDGRYAPYDSRGPYGYPDLLLRGNGRFDLRRAKPEPMDRT